MTSSAYYSLESKGDPGTQNVEDLNHEESQKTYSHLEIPIGADVSKPESQANSARVTSGNNQLTGQETTLESRQCTNIVTATFGGE